MHLFRTIEAGLIIMAIGLLLLGIGRRPHRREEQEN